MAEWWRSWHGAPTDPKWIVVGAKAGAPPGMVAAVFWAMCDHASQQSPRGSVEGFDTETLAAFYGWPEDKISTIVDVLQDKSVVEDGQLSSWDKRQPKREDSSTDRVRAFRAKRNAVKRDVTQGNAGETQVKREQNREEQRRAEESTDTEKERTPIGVPKKESEEAAAGGKENAPRRRGVTMPKDWEPNAKHAEIAEETGADLGREVEQFRDWAAAKGSVFRDWDAAFRNWLRNARKLGRGASPKNGTDEWADYRNAFTYDPDA